MLLRNGRICEAAQGVRLYWRGSNGLGDGHNEGITEAVGDGNGSADIAGIVYRDVKGGRIGIQGWYEQGIVGGGRQAGRRYGRVGLSRHAQGVDDMEGELQQG